MFSHHTCTRTCVCHHTTASKILQKELAAHKEMVTELRRQLGEKEEELQVGTQSTYGAKKYKVSKLVGHFFINI